MKVTAPPLFPDCIPVNLDIDEKWLDQELAANPGRSADEIIFTAYYGAIERGLQAMGREMQKYIDEMAARQRAASTVSGVQEKD